MALDADQIVVAGSGHVYAAPADSTLPSDPTSALDAAFVELGYTTEDGVTLTPGMDTEDVRAWQNPYAVRTLITARHLDVGFVLQQWNKDSIQLAFGGGTFTLTAGPPAYTTYEPPAPDVIDFRALVVDWEDNGDSYRLVVPRGMVTSQAETTLARTSESDLPITFGARPEGQPVAGQMATQPFVLLSDAPQLAV